MEAARILLARADRRAAESIREELVEFGYTVPAVVCSGEEAVQRVAEQAPDLVLMGVRLDGEMEGTEAARIIQQEHGVPVVFLSADPTPDDVTHAAETGAYGHLIRPFHPSELHASIETARHKHALEKAAREKLHRKCAELERALRELGGLHRLLRFQRSVHSLPEAFAEILTVVEHVLSLEDAVLYEPDPAGKRLVPVAAVGRVTPGRLEADPDLDYTPVLSLEQRDDIVVRAFVDHQPQVKGDEAAVPVLEHGHCLAVLFVHRKGLDETALRMLWNLADEVAQVLRGARMDEGMDEASACLDELRALE